MAVRNQQAAFTPLMKPSRQGADPTPCSRGQGSWGKGLVIATLTALWFISCSWLVVPTLTASDSGRDWAVTQSVQLIKTSPHAVPMHQHFNVAKPSCMESQLEILAKQTQEKMRLSTFNFFYI